MMSLQLESTRKAPLGRTLAVIDVVIAGARPLLMGLLKQTIARRLSAWRQLAATVRKQKALGQNRRSDLVMAAHKTLPRRSFF
ncbi:MAG: hypothetical protein K2Q97_16305 [Burkholderiaceae bacterium]|nr:hypothetical protein [Burkholderiaceae bacterium]